jgi:hypothetical protein
VISL